MIATFKRVLGVSYPPILGLLVISFGLKQLFAVVALSYVTSLLGLALAVVLRCRLLLAFEYAIQGYAGGRSTIAALLSGAMRIWRVPASEVTRVSGELKLFGQVHRGLLLLGAWVFGVYSVSMFTINLVASAVPQYASIILQCGGLINAFGTIIMAFFYDPRVSKKLDDGANKGLLYRSIVSANFLSIVFFAPIYFLIALFHLGISLIDPHRV